MEEFKTAMSRPYVASEYVIAPAVTVPDCGRSIKWNSASFKNSALAPTYIPGHVVQTTAMSGTSPHAGHEVKSFDAPGAVTGKLRTYEDPISPRSRNTLGPRAPVQAQTVISAPTVLPTQSVVYQTAPSVVGGSVVLSPRSTVVQY